MGISEHSSPWLLFSKFPFLLQPFIFCHTSSGDFAFNPAPFYVKEENEARRRRCRGIS